MTQPHQALATLDRIKGAAICAVGGVMIVFAVKNWLAIHDSTIGMAYLRAPRVVMWAYENLGVLPASILQAALGLAVISYGGLLLFRKQRIQAEH
jgi:hypothetical protein